MGYLRDNRCHEKEEEKKRDLSQLFARAIFFLIFLSLSLFFLYLAFTIDPRQINSANAPTHENITQAGLLGAMYRSPPRIEKPI